MGGLEFKNTRLGFKGHFWVKGSIIKSLCILLSKYRHPENPATVTEPESVAKRRKKKNQK
jgi:hypothetical protein